MRNRIGAKGARCNSNAADTASEARANAATKLSPSPCSTGRTPSWEATTSHTTWLKRAIAAVISSGWFSHSRVEPSTSANSNVTVPVGKSPLTPSSLQSTSGASARGSMSLMLASMREARSAKHQRKRVDRGRVRAGISSSGVAGCFLDELHPRAEAEFGVDVGEVGLHGARRDEKPGGDVVVA